MKKKTTKADSRPALAELVELRGASWLDVRAEPDLAEPTMLDWFREAAEAHGQGAWTLYEAIVPEPAAVAILVLLPRGMDDAAFAEALRELVEWAGLDAEDLSTTRAYAHFEDDAASTAVVDFGFDGSALRVFPEHRCALYVAAVEAAALGQIFAAVTFTDRLTQRADAPPAAPAASLEALMVKEPAERAWPGPAWRDILRLTAAGRALDATCTFEGGSDLDVIMDARAGFFMASFDSNPPGGGSFEDMLALIPPAALAKPIAKVEAQMKRPRGTPAQHAALARLFRQAFVELAERPVTPKKAAKKAARKAAKKTATKAAKKTAKSARKVAKR